MTIIFGPAGMGAVKDAINNLEYYNNLGLSACEIAFTYGAYIKNDKDAEMIAKKANELGINLSIHAHYYINLNSKENAKIQASKKRILECCKIGEALGAKYVVFHPGFYTGIDKEETYQTIKKAVIEIMEEIKKNKWSINIAAETTGKVNVFGSIEEIAKLVHETGCSFTIDFAHILAREKKIDYKRIIDNFGKYKDWHCHFSGIKYGEKGEKNHKGTTKEEWKELLENLPKDKNITIINESPFPVEDSIMGLKISRKLI